MSDPATIDPDDHHRLNDILQRSPVLTRLAGHVRSFATMMCGLRGQHLETWMAAVEADDLPALHSFVLGLRRDQDAVTSGLTLPYNSGPVEGHVNRIKMLKRQMYGRAKPDLLRKRILLSEIRAPPTRKVHPPTPGFLQKICPGCPIAPTRQSSRCYGCPGAATYPLSGRFRSIPVPVFGELVWLQRQPVMELAKHPRQ